MIADNHNHFILDGGDPTAMVEAAVAAGVAELIFCEHGFHIQELRAVSPYLCRRWQPEGRPLPLAEYRTRIAAAAATAAIPVRVGIELEAENPSVGDAQDVLGPFDGADWDVVIGSVHVIGDDRDIHDPAEVEGSVADAWRDYVRLQIAAARSGRFDIIAHPVRLAMSLDPPRELPGLLDELAAAAVAGDVALEVNGNDHRRSPAAVAALVGACVRTGAAISLGSDAHRPNSAGRVRAALGLLHDAGVREIASFAGRERRALPLR